MSLTFSRRSFLKYTAVAAVAVAGSSLLTGCKDDNTATLNKYGTITTLQAKATMDKATYSAANETVVFNFEVYCGRGNDMTINTQNFYVTVTDGNGDVVYKSTTGRIEVSESLDSFNLENKATASGTVTATNIPALTSDCTVTFKYKPDTTYGEYVSEWNISYDLLELA